ncbi:isopenicillin N synthase family dioxygenase [Paraliomyxa miuraensis]|uniref:isopenicillin N synthase family dioxygenase n=1 Tax=Paraliomyxa miuraensis TaxID=376150 RepID=UPI002256E585|nr:2-oxoglutarate and iron-dependent oxygenase domain-containing protein [Paraliomyxa miuraensis]MCX4247798.1 isopenicillin N synthase family oxygenase [Paraliomyxa miuraensis]
MRSIPVIDVAPLRAGGTGSSAVAAAIDAACRDVGFFAITGHGIELPAFERLRRAAAAFFALPEAVKGEVAMAHGGRAWRGWFPVGGELTSGQPDLKEGLYFGLELPSEDPRVRAGVPLHGPNLFPAEPVELRPLVLEWIERVTAVGHVVMQGIAMGLGLPPEWFREHLTGDPVVLFRIFHYPPAQPGRWGVAEHTDYGLLTLLAQDGHDGLEVETSSGWIEVPARPGELVCNLGDMLDRLTGGRHRSTRHRVRNRSGAGRLSFPLFFDPSWEAEVPRLPGIDLLERPDPRWDGADLQAWSGRYGEYLTAKVSRVFPELFAAQLGRDVVGD